MQKLPESLLAIMSFGRLRLHRSRVLREISANEGEYCCELKCEWKPKFYPFKDEDYKYRDLVNKYYDIGLKKVKC